MSWSSKKKQPGQNVTLNLKGSAGSICGSSVVDRSVTYARADLQLSESNIYNRLPGLHIPAGSYPQQVTPDWKYCEKSKDSHSLKRTHIIFLHSVLQQKMNNRILVFLMTIFDVEKDLFL